MSTSDSTSISPSSDDEEKEDKEAAQQAEWELELNSYQARQWFGKGSYSGSCFSILLYFPLNTSFCNAEILTKQQTTQWLGVLVVLLASLELERVWRIVVLLPDGRFRLGRGRIGREGNDGGDVAGHVG